MLDTNMNPQYFRDGGKAISQSSNDGGKAISLSSNVLVAAIIFFFVVVLFIFFLHLYARWRWGPVSSSRGARTLLVFGPDQDPIAAPRRGLDTAVIHALPVCVYKLEDFKEGIECAVCLSELADGEKARLLPKCNHGFHLECIDMWFASHSTCPLCRNLVGEQPVLDLESGVQQPPEAISRDGYSTEQATLPTNVLFWGRQDEVNTGGGSETGALQEVPLSSSLPPTPPPPPPPQPSTSSGKSEGMLVIEIPRRTVDGFSSSPLPSSRFPAEDMKSPVATATTPTMARLRSLTRLLSREKRVVGSSFSPCGGDIEQGGIGGGSFALPTPRTPRAF